jgi:hypothetical protein
MTEIDYMLTMRRAWLEMWIEENEKPAWFDWFDFYPAKSSVNAAKAQLKAMDQGLEISTKDTFDIFK